MRSKVFISYSSIDATIAEEVALSLRDSHVEYFLDRKDIEWGGDIPQRIADGVAECDYLLVVLSPASLKSAWVPYEVGQAIALRKTILPFLTHPSLDLPGYLQNYSHKVRLDDVKEYFRRLSASKDRETDKQSSHSSGHDPLASRPIVESMAMLFVDVMRLLGIACSETARMANLDRYAQFVRIAERHLSDFRSAFARLAGRLHEDTEVRCSLLEKRLSWMLGRLESGPPPCERMGEYFEVMQKIATDLHDACASALGERYADQVRRVDSELHKISDRDTLRSAVDPLDELWRVRLELQSRLLAESKSDQYVIESIGEDMDQQFGTLYFALDRQLLPMILQRIGAE